MNPILDAGITLILALQGLGEWLISPMKFFSLLGNEEFFLMVMPALYWCMDAGIGLRMGIILMFSNNLNGILKTLMQGPRPYFYDPRVAALSSETSFGIPSGHAQNAAAMWGFLAAKSRRLAGWILAILLILLIGISRMYLGVHFPTDVLLGWITGAALVWGFLRLEPLVVRRLSHQNMRQQIVVVSGTTLVMVLIPVLVKISLGAWTLPAAWITNIQLAFPDGDLPDPVALSGQLTVAGAFFGLALGAIFIKHQGGFHAGGSWWKRLARFPVGLAGVLILYLGLGAIFPRGEALIPYLFRFLRYALIGLWISWMAPSIFIRIGWAQADQQTMVESETQPASL